MVGRHKINGPAKQIVVEEALIPAIMARPGESVSKKIRRILQENAEIETLKEQLANEKDSFQYWYDATNELLDRINFSRRTGAGIPYPPWMESHRTIGASFCLAVPHDDKGNAIRFDLVYSNKCTRCKDGKCDYNATDLANYCIGYRTLIRTNMHRKDDCMHYW